MEYTELTLGVDETRNLALVYPLLYQNSINLAVDQTSDIFEENNAFIITVCIDREANGYQLYENVKDSIREVLLEKEFEHIVNQKVQEVDITINEKLLNRMKENVKG